MTKGEAIRIVEGLLLGRIRGEMLPIETQAIKRLLQEVKRD